MGPVRRTLVLIVVLLVADASGAQQAQETAGLSDFPVPFWPANGVVPQELKDKYVFVDVAANEFVLA